MVDQHLPQLISFGVTVIGLLCAVIGFLGAGYTKHVDRCIETLFKKIDTEATARNERWAKLHTSCNECVEAIGYLKGRLNNTK
jgi:hypothetical protein